MQIDHFFDDGEADAVALGGVRLITLVELLEDTIQLIRRDGFARVDDGHSERVRGFGDRDLELTEFGGELDGVVDQIDPDLLEQFLTGFDAVFIKVQIQLQFLFAPLAFQQQDTGADLL